jgi:hypothetical protein
MSEFEPIGFGGGPTLSRDGHHFKLDTTRIVLHRVLEFTRHSIDDVVNDSIIKREVLGYYKLHLSVERRCEEIDRNRRETFGRINF